MTPNEYVEQAMRTNDHKQEERLTKSMNEWTPQLLNGCLGLAGEAGEFGDMVKKFIFHEKPLDFEHLEKELGDVLWYVALICDAMGWDLESIMETNIAKLKARYPEGFSVERANNREEGDV